MRLRRPIQIDKRYSAAMFARYLRGINVANWAVCVAVLCRYGWTRQYRESAFKRLANGRTGMLA